ncbi:hypothetical protein [Paenibacillus sp. DMB20]|uniref:hypothetical protein n=1 Tax=Paenibacillus sp. DMB20 TaxID=1642570 RepID=UPI0006279203|nr:hypothetical protein [Paenibacillus sp. DMB20]KKO50976.1 hypothetical protein XI25_28545 [Paenibacillus sp. DMB20]
MYIIYQKVAETTGRVQEVIFFPTEADKTRPGRDIGDKPMVYPDNIPGLASRLMINLETDELYYDYYAPKTVESKITELGQENGALRQAVAELTMMMIAPQAPEGGEGL